MVDVGGKDVTDRRALASAVVRVSEETARAIRDGDAPKGDVIGTARIAGIQAAKRTAELIPLCHPLPLSFVDVRIEVARPKSSIEAEARTTAQTGVEMEAHDGCRRGGAYRLRHGQGHRARSRDRRNQTASENRWPGRLE